MLASTCDDNSESQLSTTSSEIEKEIDVLRKTFDFVRLLKADGPHGVSGCVENPCQCFSFWKVDEPCENCISLKTFIDKKPRTKLEFMGTDIYQVFSKYVQVDGEPYVMELIKKLDEDSLLGVQDREKIMNKRVPGKSVPLWRVIFSAGTDSFAIHSANRNRSLPIVFKPPW